MSKVKDGPRAYDGPLIPLATLTVMRVRKAVFVGISAGNSVKKVSMISEDAAYQLAALLLELQDTEGNIELKASRV